MWQFPASPTVSTSASSALSSPGSLAQPRSPPADRQPDTPGYQESGFPETEPRAWHGSASDLDEFDDLAVKREEDLPKLEQALSHVLAQASGDCTKRAKQAKPAKQAKRIKHSKTSQAKQSKLKPITPKQFS